MRALTSRTHETPQGWWARLLLALLGVYRHAISPVLQSANRVVTGSPGACRFLPTCSEYAVLAVELRGPTRGVLLAAGRFLRCHPFSRGGFDPVPARNACGHVNREKHTAGAIRLP